jgi:hypothetical protein
MRLIPPGRGAVPNPEVDALITSWNSKVFFVFWRSITAIQKGNNDGNPQTIGDPAWLPQITTLNYPSKLQAQ